MSDSGKTVKCIVWDLDDTIWDGVLLEGAVALRPEAVAAIKALDERGILHSIASKNDRALALQQIEAFGLADYFLCPQIGWDPKSRAVERIAERLNIGIDSLAFIDDQPFEREEVRFAHPQVRCLDSRSELEGLIERPEMKPRFATEDQKRRRVMYREDFSRQAAEESFEGTAEAFLASLGMRLRIAPAADDDLARAEELTQRTHQLNSTGYTYDYDELAALQRSPDHLLLVAQLRDRFGDYGKIGLALIECGDGCWTLKLLLMSCRVMTRGVGSALLRDIMRRAREAGVRLQAEFLETARNRPMKITFRFAGFKPAGQRDGLAIFERDLAEIPALPGYMQVDAVDRAAAGAAG